MACSQNNSDFDGAERTEKSSRSSNCGFHEPNQPGKQVGRSDAVSERVMDLADQGKSAVGQPLDEMELPQGTAAVERSARRSRRSTGRVLAFHLEEGTDSPQVRAKIHGGVFEPHRMVKPKRDSDKFVPQRIQQVKPILHSFAELLEIEVTTSLVREDGDLQRVGVQVWRLAVATAWRPSRSCVSYAPRVALWHGRTPLSTRTLFSAVRVYSTE